MTHTLTLKRITPVTHDTHHLVFDRPAGYTFTPGQATDFRLDRDGWRDEIRPFTFTSDPGADTLEFVIKSYPVDAHPDHGGVTERIGRLTPGDRVIIGEPWGAIADRGAGVFIAGGAGITPFIPILRQRGRDGAADACMLIFSNKAERDIILREEWQATPGLSVIFTVTDEAHATLPNRVVDAAFLDEVVTSFRDTFYVCGPDPMVEAVVAALQERGVPEDRIVTEKF